MHLPCQLITDARTDRQARFNSVYASFAFAYRRTEAVESHGLFRFQSIAIRGQVVYTDSFTVHFSIRRYGNLGTNQ